MSQRTDEGIGLSVGLVGAGGSEHWSGRAHIPALRAVDGVELLRLVTSRAESARLAEEVWGVPATHELDRMLDDPRIDLVVVATGVTAHAEVASRAIAAGKHVYCEWPLGIDAEQAADLARQAASAPGSRCVVGLQGRQAPELGAARAAVGMIGRVIGFTLSSHVALGMIARPAHRAHLRRREAAADALTIGGGHALDLAEHLIGRLTPEWARLWCALDEFEVEGSGERLARDAPDNLMAGFAVDGGWGVASVSQTGASGAFAFDVLGTGGQLRLRGHGLPQFSRLTLGIVAPDGRDLTPEVAPVARIGELDASGPAYNLALMYAALRAALVDGASDDLPGFDEAVALHELLDDVRSMASEREALTGAGAGR